jgi:regulatory protein
MKTERSLKGRALQLLAQRDQSRLELRRKLIQHARRRVAKAQGAVEIDGAGDAETLAAEIDALLDWLVANHFLSEERFVESRVNARQARFGLARIRSELAQHDVALPADLAAVLAGSELERAAAARARRFASAPRSAAEQAAQSRFLLGRGFSPELVGRLMRRLGRALPSDAEPPRDPA